MKTVREILLERHRSVEPKLDAIREAAVGMLAQSTANDRGCVHTRDSLARAWLSTLQSLRWHLAGLGAAWLAIALLNVDHTPPASPVAAKQNVPSPRQLLAAVRENRRKLLEMLEPPASDPTLAPPRRSESSTPTATA